MLLAILLEYAAKDYVSYGTPFLLDLGLSEQMTSLVWLAGPISGLIAQPVIGM
jgi:solute carrier family 45 protein 1/2/4